MLSYVIVIVIFKQGVRSAQADFQRSPVYITHTTNSNIYTYKLAIHIIHTKKYNNKNITTKHRHKTKNKLQQNQYKTKNVNVEIVKIPSHLKVMAFSIKFPLLLFPVRIVFEYRMLRFMWFY